MDRMQDAVKSGPTDKPQLAAHEYLAVIVIIGFFAMITLISVFRQESLPIGAEGEAHYLKPQIVEVYIQGAVESPGAFKVKVNSKVQDVIILAQPLKEADLRRYKPTAKVRAGQIITVPSRSMIEITVTGAVENPGLIKVPRGLRLHELGAYVQFSSKAVPSKIKHKAALKAGDSVFVPSSE
jgi:hypothetical protein